jgi:hypothetical protein
MSELLVFMVDASIIVFTAFGSMLIMDSCFLKFSENKGMKLPLQKIKVYKNGKLSRTINTGFTLENNINGN